MVGRGPRWEAIEALFEAQCRRIGLNTDPGDGDNDEPSTFVARLRKASSSLSDSG
jgi:hypothetical protein